MTHKTLDSFMQGITVTVKGMTEREFEKKVKKIFKKVAVNAETAGSAHALAKAAVISYLQRSGGKGSIPNIRTGNLRDKIAFGYIEEATPTKTQTGNILSFKWTTIISPDRDKMGNYLVTNKGAPYAHYLNTSAKFSRYNNFMEQVVRVYSNNFRKTTDDQLTKEFGTGFYRY